MKYFLVLTLFLATLSARAVSIDAIYFAQTHVHKADNPYFGTVADRDVFIKAHVTDPVAPTSPSVFATLSLNGQFLTVPLTGPATLPVSIPDGLGVVQHSTANSFTGVIPAAWVKVGLQVTVNAGTVMTTVPNMKVSAPTKVIMTMTDVHYFARNFSDYTSGTFAELEAKWPVADIELRRLNNAVFRELVIPPRSDVSAQAVRIKSKAEYQAQTGLAFDGEQAAALEWNGALKRAAGTAGRWSLYYLNVYNAFAGGQAGGFAGVGAGANIGIFHHELGHALSLPHWGDNGAYPYKGDMHGIQAPANYNETHAGPAWAFHQPTNAFIPPVTVTGNVGGKPVGTYTVDPMQGGGTGYQPAGYLMNHFSDYSVNQMRNYMNGHVVVWNPTLNSGNGSWAQWNQTAGAYTTAVSNNGVQYPTTRDVSVISIMATVSGSKPAINMVYPPVGPYTSGLIRLFDPAVTADRTAAQSIFSPTNGSDYCVRVVQGGVTKTYMLAASALTGQSLTTSASIETEAVNLPAADGAVTRIELLSTPNVEDVGLPATPTVLYAWGPLMPATATFGLPPEGNSSSSVTMTAEMGEVGYGYTGGSVEYMFTETSGNPGATSSAWQTARSYTDTGLQAGTTYTYTVSMRAGTLTSATSAPVSTTTTASGLASTITIDATQTFDVASGNGYKAATGLGTFNAAGKDKVVVIVAMEHSNNEPAMTFGVRYNGVQMIEAVQQTGGNNDGTIAIYYLDNPAVGGTGGISISGYNPNGGLGVAYALSGTRPGYGAFNSRTGNAITQVPLTTSADKSLVIAALQNSGNTNSAGTPTANAPLVQAASANWGSQWGSLAAGSMQVATPSAVTPTFTGPTGGSYSINIAAVEFLSEPLAASTWTQTAGGAQSWTTAANWIANAVPITVAGDSVDFSTVDIAANTTLTLGADRIGGLWKFGDLTGVETWTVNAGNTITLAGTTPGIEVVTNTATLNGTVAGTAGLSKTGAGTLILNGTNTYTGVTRISAGTLVAATLANGGSNSSIGAATNVASNLILNAGTLQYTGPTVSTNRLFSLQASSTIDASGTGAVNFNNAGSMGFNSNTAAKTLTLTGTNTDANTLASIIGDNTGATSLTKSGIGTWALSGANTFTGATTISGGTLRLANTAAVSASNLVAIGGNTLHLATNAAFSSSVPLSMQVGTLVSDRATAGAGLTHVFGAATIGNGTNNFIAGPNVTSGAAAIQFGNVSNNNGSTATPGLNPTTANLIITGDVTLGTSNTGTANLTLGGTGSVNSIAGIIENGTRTSGNVIKSGSSTWTLSGLSATAASNYNGSTTIDEGTLRITTTSPSLTGSLTFGAAAGGNNLGALDLSTASATFGGALLVRTSSTTANTISIGNGRTLQVGGAFTVGFNATAIPHTFTRLAVSGAGTLSIGTSTTPTNALFQIGNGATTAVGNAGSLDMSGLTTFYANLGNGIFRVGSPTNINSANGGGSTVNLAANNTIQAATMLLGGPDANAVQSMLLGSGINIINVDTLNLGGLGAADGRSSGSITFQSTAGTLKIRSQADPVNGRTNLNFGVINMNTGIPQPNILFDTNGHSADLRFGTMNLASRTQGTGATTVQFRFDAGTLDANDLTVGSRGGAAGAASTATGTVTIGGGTVTLNTTTAPIQLGVNALAAGTAAGTLNISGGTVSVLANAGTSIRLAEATTSGGTATGTLNLTGGTLTVAGDILRGAATGTSNATVRLSGGTLNMGGHDLGAAGSGALIFTVESGTLQNVASINGTAGLTKTTAGILSVAGTNTYTGPTTISSGTLALAAINTLPATDVSIGSATLNAATFTDTLGTLNVTGTSVINLGSGAALTFADSSAITWAGTLSVTGTFVSGSSLRFGTSAIALTATQLGKISGGGFSSFSLNSSGYLVGSNGATYTTWQSANSSAGAFTADHDNDGVANGIEYFIGGNSNTTGQTVLPSITDTSGTLSITWTKSATYPGTYGTHFWIETTDTLTGIWTTETLGGNVTQIGNNITYTFPASARRFARLKVVGP
ncbi:MAG: autotransporter-associated beta strand repeat-containing protein [Verrucomicrobia bacterium]|nr:autotransporter-associated beta strand repeat-containing protein [Verrucomicrobiota bacterium]